MCTGLDLAHFLPHAGHEECRMDAPTTPPPSAGAARREARLATPRMTRELDTLAAMLRIYCHDHHAAAAPDELGLCAECGELLAYARKRLAGCPFGVDKPTCARSPPRAAQTPGRPGRQASAGRREQRRPFGSGSDATGAGRRRGRQNESRVTAERC